MHAYNMKPNPTASGKPFKHSKFLLCLNPAD